MLVLTRYEDQETVLYDEDGRELGTVTVLAIRSNRVKLGFKFRPGIPIMRAEAQMLIGDQVVAPG